jgi:hypothetical protein
VRQCTQRREKNERNGSNAAIQQPPKLHPDSCLHHHRSHGAPALNERTQCKHVCMVDGGAERPHLTHAADIPVGSKLIREFPMGFLYDGGVGRVGGGQHSNDDVMGASSSIGRCSAPRSSLAASTSTNSMRSIRLCRRGHSCLAQ